MQVVVRLVVITYSLVERQVEVLDLVVVILVLVSVHCAL